MVVDENDNILGDGEQGWIVWNGGEMPVPVGTLVDIRIGNTFRSEILRRQTADKWNWKHDCLARIEYYRICEVNDA